MSWQKDYLSFTRRDRNALIAFVMIVGVFLYLPEFFRPRRVTAAIGERMQQEILTHSNRPADRQQESESWQTPYAAPKPRAVKLFVFDPNTLDEAGFVQLGVPERTARTIINYRNKGGKFRHPEDLRKIYTLRKEDADRIIPYARVATASAPGYSSYNNNSYNNTSYNNEQSAGRSRTIQPVDINTATAEEWKALPGIGDVLSDRIVKYRNRLGGFRSIDDVAGTYGLSDSSFQRIKPYLRFSAPAPRKINLNTAFVHELMECRHISRELALSILSFRQRNKRFESVEDLKKIPAISEELFEQIAPHVTVN